MSGRPVVLLPPSKGKADGGDGPAYAATLDGGHPLTTPRRTVLAAAVAAAEALDDRSLARVCGVRGADVDATRAAMRQLETAPTLPAHRRYSGIVHGNAGLADLDPRALEVDVRVVSPLLGLVAADELVPAYRLELAASLPELGGLGTFWRDHVGPLLRTIGTGVRIWDLLPAEHARAWPASARAGLEVVTVRFLRPDGRAANAARTKVCKGRLAAALVATPTLEPVTLVRAVDPGPGWRLAADGPIVTATFTD